MSERRRLLDLFCKAGGATRGYQLADFRVTGVDIDPQPRYVGDHFCQADIMEVGLRLLLRELGPFDAVHASPPCQAFTEAHRIRGRSHPDLVGPLRPLLVASGLPYVIENVPGAPLHHPHLLCGAMFDLGVHRHRLFETNFPLPFLLHSHSKKQAKMGRAPEAGEVMQVVGHFSDVTAAREAMGIDWMTRDELAQAIPPAYTEWIGRHLLAHLEQAA